MSHANVYYQGVAKKEGVIAGEVIEVTDRWVTIVPDDESISKILIPYSRAPIVQYCPHPNEESKHDNENRKYCLDCKVITFWDYGHCIICGRSKDSSIDKSISAYCKLCEITTKWENGKCIICNYGE